MDWTADSACRYVRTDAEQDDFFGIEENAPISRSEVAAARMICRELCPVVRECLKAALSGDEGWGVWGGYTAAERTRAVTKLTTTRAVMASYDAGTLDGLVRVRD